MVKEKIHKKKVVKLVLMYSYYCTSRVIEYSDKRALCLTTVNILDNVDVVGGKLRNLVNAIHTSDWESFAPIAHIPTIEKSKL